MNMLEVNTYDLIGPALDWAIWLAVRGEAGEPCKRIKRIWTSLDEYWSPSTDWSQGGPLIEKYTLRISPHVRRNGVITSWAADTHWPCNITPGQCGPTPLIAACRAIVHSQLGDTVQVPAELMPEVEN